MRNHSLRRLLPGLLIGALVGLAMLAGRIQAQDEAPHPTPIVIDLTPTVGPTAVSTATPDPAGLLPDRFEPNDTAETAVQLGWQTEADLTLLDGDVDWFTGYLKGGQRLQLSTAVTDGLDTRIRLFWDGQMVAENDDRAGVDIGSLVTFTAPADGWYLAEIGNAAVTAGGYTLEAAPAAPQATPTALPTLTPTPSPTPLVQPDPAEPNNGPEAASPLTPGLTGTYTVGAGDVDYFSFIAKANSRYVCETETEQVDTLLTVIGVGANDDRGVGRVDSSFSWETTAEQTVVVEVTARGGSYGPYALSCRQAAPAAPPVVMPPVQPPATSSDGASVDSNATHADAVLTETGEVSATMRIPLTVRHLGAVLPQMTTTPTEVRLLVYYDANNDRQPGPAEGIPNVSVLAVDAQGQRIARVFTNLQGEAVFNLQNDAVARVVVPFVPGWSARVRAGAVNDEIVLGLPAVRLPVFLPVQNRVGEEE